MAPSLQVLVVCVGNICRSPMAEALLAVALPHAEVSSAGIGAMVGHPADAVAVDLMTAAGLDVTSHRARQLNSQLCEQNQVILVMETKHKEFIEKQYPFVTGKVYLLGHFHKMEIPDPYRKERAAFEAALTQIKDGVAAWAPRIARL